MIETRKCPFCKNEKVVFVASVTLIGGIQHNKWYLKCEKCEAHTLPTKTKKQAILAWNGVESD